MKKDSLGWKSAFLIKDKAEEKLLLAKNDPQILALLLAEFLLTMTIVVGIILYLDAEVNVIEYPFNLIIFGFLLFGVFRLYSYTERFRSWRGMKKKSSAKVIALELFLIAFVIVSAYLYQDQAINILPYPFNIFAFLGILSVPLWFYIEEKFVK